MNDMGRAVAAAEARGLRLSGEQRNALEHVIRRPRLSLVVGLAGTGKSAMLGVAREAWESAGYTVRGAALSGIATENLEGGPGLTSRTNATPAHGWAQGPCSRTPPDVPVRDKAAKIRNDPVHGRNSEAGHITEG